MGSLGANTLRVRRWPAVVVSSFAVVMGYFVGVATLFVPAVVVLAGVPVLLVIAAVSGLRPRLIADLALLWCVLNALILLYLAWFYFG